MKRGFRFCGALALAVLAGGGRLPAAGPAGREAPARIVSLVPEASEIIIRLGAGNRLAGVAREDAHSPGLAGKPAAGGEKNPCFPLIKSLKPDLLILGREEAASPEAAGGYELLAWESGGDWAAAAAKIRRLGCRLGAEAEAERLAAAEGELLETVALKMARLSPERRRRAVFVRGGGEIGIAGEADAPSALIRAAGGLTPGWPGGERPASLDEWLAWNPQAILAESGEREELEALLARPGWREAEAAERRSILYLPAALLRGSAGRFGQIAAWLSSSLYPEEYADPAFRVRDEGILGVRPVPLDLPYVENARIVECRLGDFRHHTLLLDFKEPQTVLSTADGQLSGVASVGNSSSPPPMWEVNHRLGGRTARANLFRVLGLRDGTASLLFTGADLDNLAIRTAESAGLGVVVLATAGAEANALRLSRDYGAYVEPGTINLIVLANRRLGPAALAAALATVTEAKTAALWDLDVRSSQTPRENPATGTGTDGVILVAGEGAEAEFVGGHARLGQLLAEATHAAVSEALFRQNGFHPGRPPRARLAERRIRPEEILQARPGSPALREFDRLLRQPPYREFLEAAFALSDAELMGQGTFREGFEGWALAIASRIAGRPLPALAPLPRDPGLPGVLATAFRAFATGLGEGGDF
ncbi:MAG: adenosylcobinamide amidohydrolase [Planctomycetota bacterium]|nr:adenosylcobinamide amidohydrolase [Planctomycetota bacterium]